MSETSETLLTWLRDLLANRQLNTATVAQRALIPRPRLRKILGGREPMTVNELLQICRALDITPNDMGLPNPDDLGVPKPAPKPAPATLKIDQLNPFGNHPQQLLKVAFALGCDFLFLANTEELENSGVPASVLEKHAGRNLGIRLDAAYHEFNEPRYEEEGVELTLSFDSLQKCWFPWSSIVQVVFYPEPFDATPPDSDEEDPAGAPSHLRLVE